MTDTKQIKVPDIGGFDAVDVVEVLVSVGDEVAIDDPLITLESDKASMEVPSTSAGRVTEVHVKAGGTVSEGDLIVTMEVAVNGAPARPEPQEPEQTKKAEQQPSVGEAKPARPTQPETPSPEPRAPSPEPRVPSPQPAAPVSSLPHASPAIRRFARELGVDLARVEGSGRKGRITREDVQGFVKQRMSAGTSAGGGSVLPAMPEVDFARFGDIERVELSRIQKLSGPNLQRSWLHVPHVTQHDEADITELETFRKAHSEEAKGRGFKLTPVAFILKACAAALKEYPRVNSSLDPDGEHLVLKHYFHIGVAVDTDEGLVVPVIRDVDQKSIYELAEELGTTSEAARDGRLKLDQLQGASFTVSSLGGIGGTGFTPIVNAPEVAILGVSRSRIQPVWDGLKFEPRLMLPLSLSYDHRVVDGALAVRFTTYLSSVLSDIRRLLL